MSSQTRSAPDSDAVAKRSDSLCRSLTAFKQLPRAPVHSFHRYFGKLIPAIPAFAIAEFTSAGDLVLDSFCGSGTTAVEALVAGRRSLGIDKNGLATFVARVKTRRLDAAALSARLADVVAQVRFGGPTSDLSLPYVVNLAHWFRPAVLADLLSLRSTLRAIETEPEQEFFLACFSAFLRGVSNADPMHVFPGYSKRMRRLDAEGRQIDVLSSFERAVSKRIAQVSVLPDRAGDHDFRTGDAREALAVSPGASLAVVNPPYISSIRYLETMKIEMGWLGFVLSKADYLEQDRQMVGTERFYKRDLENVGSVGLPELDLQIDRLRADHPKMARVVHDYFVGMAEAFTALRGGLLKGGHLVVKINDSQVRTELISTHRYFIDLCAAAGLALIGNFEDPFDPNSRSLLTARNSYSGIMHVDRILVFVAT